VVVVVELVSKVEWRSRLSGGGRLFSSRLRGGGKVIQQVERRVGREGYSAAANILSIRVR
jgi:hypothetical protein